MNAFVTSEAPDSCAIFTGLTLVKGVDFFLAVAALLHTLHVLALWGLFLVVLLGVLNSIVAYEWLMYQLVNLRFEGQFHLGEVLLKMDHLLL